MTTRKYTHILVHRSNNSLAGSIDRTVATQKRQAKLQPVAKKVGKSRLVAAIVFKPQAAPKVNEDELERAKWDAIANGKTDVQVVAGKVKYANRLWHCYFHFQATDGSELKKPVVISGKSENDVTDKMLDYKVRAKVLGASSFQMVEPSGLKREPVYLRHPEV